MVFLTPVIEKYKGYLMRDLILAFDGGGVKGFFSASTLHILNNIIQSNNNISMREYLSLKYDRILFAGTSVGSIIASYLFKCFIDNQTINLMSISSEILKVVFSKRRFFPLGTNGKYKSEELSRMIEKHCLPSNTLSDKFALLIPAWCPELDDYAVKFTSDYKTSKFSGIALRDMILGSCSAPTFFSPVKVHTNDMDEISIIDGGIIMNNPSMMIFSDYINYFKLREIDVINIGVRTKNKIKYGNYFDILKTMINASTSTRVEEYYLKSLEQIIPRMRFLSAKMDDTKPYNMDDVSESHISALNIEALPNAMKIFKFLED